MKKKYFKILSLLLFVILSLLGFTFNYQQERQFLEVNFLDVGQGDAILIKTPYEQNILIDGGPDNKVLSELGKNLAFYDKEIDLMILTHPHADHLVGLIEVLRRYKVKEILMTGVLHTSPPYETFLEEIKKQKIRTEIGLASKEINFGQNLSLKILNPIVDLSKKEVENLNNSSIVAKLVYQNNSFLLTGDIENKAEQELINSGADLKADVLKIAHHGSKDSMIPEFLEAVKPEYAVISVGKNNDFFHPHPHVINLLKQNKIKIFRTDKNGTIKFISNGINLKIKTGK